MSDLKSYLLVAGAAALLSYLLTPLVRLASLRLGAVDLPGGPQGRKIHAVATPTLGGLAMFLAYLGALALAARMDGFRQLFAAERAPGWWPLPVVSDILGVTVGATMMVVIGLVDDVQALTAPAKLAAQVFAAGSMTLAGVQVLYFWLPTISGFGGTIALSSDLGVPVTILLVLVTVNAVNLVDGLDGLAAGLVGIAALAYFIYSYRMAGVGVIAADSPAPLLSCLLLGVCVGFLPHNFNPARIFMGDSGAMLLGTLLSGATVTGIGQTSKPTAGNQLAFLIPVLIPFFVLALPFIDTLFAIGRRVRSGHGIMVADKDHLHHRLLQIGHSHRAAVLVLYGWSALLAGSAVALSFRGPKSILPVFAVTVVLGILLLLAPRWRAGGRHAAR